MKLSDETRAFLLDLSHLIGGEPAMRKFFHQMRRDVAVAANRERLSAWRDKRMARLCGAAVTPEGALPAYTGMVDPIRGPKCPVTPAKAKIEPCVWPPPKKTKAPAEKIDPPSNVTRLRSKERSK